MLIYLTLHQSQQTSQQQLVKHHPIKYIMQLVLHYSILGIKLLKSSLMTKEPIEYREVILIVKTFSNLINILFQNSKGG